MKKLLASATALSLTVIGMNALTSLPAQAGCGWLDITCKSSGIRKSLKDMDPTNPNGSIRTKVNNSIHRQFNVQVENNTNRTIWVAAHYRQTAKCPVSLVTASRCKDVDIWRTSNGYWKLAPGEKAYVLDTENRYIYFHAHDAQGNTWGNRNYTYSVNGHTRSFFQVDMGSKMVSFTQGFTQ